MKNKDTHTQPSYLESEKGHSGFPSNIMLRIILDDFFWFNF